MDLMRDKIVSVGELIQLQATMDINQISREILQARRMVSVAMKRAIRAIEGHPLAEYEQYEEYKEYITPGQANMWMDGTLYPCKNALDYVIAKMVNNVLPLEFSASAQQVLEEVNKQMSLPDYTSGWIGCGLIGCRCTLRPLNTALAPFRPPELAPLLLQLAAVEDARHTAQDTMRAAKALAEETAMDEAYIAYNQSLNVIGSFTSELNRIKNLIYDIT